MLSHLYTYYSLIVTVLRSVCTYWCAHSHVLGITHSIRPSVVCRSILLFPQHARPLTSSDCAMIRPWNRASLNIFCTCATPSRVRRYNTALKSSLLAVRFRCCTAGRCSGYSRHVSLRKSRGRSVYFAYIVSTFRFNVFMFSRCPL